MGPTVGSAAALLQQFRKEALKPGRDPKLSVVRAGLEISNTLQKRFSFEPKEPFSSTARQTEGLRDVLSLLIDLCSLCKRPQPALCLWRSLSRPKQLLNEMGFSGLTRACSIAGDVVVARQLLELAESTSPSFGVPNVLDCNQLLSTFALISEKNKTSQGAVDEAQRVLGVMLRFSIAPTIITDTILITLYCKHGNLRAARHYFDSRVECATGPVALWDAMLAGYARHGNSADVLDLYELMGAKHVRPDCITFVSLLQVCGHMKDLDRGKEEYFEICKRGIEIKGALSISLVEMYCKCGSMVDAQSTFDEILLGPERSSVALRGAMMSGYLHNNFPGKALCVFDAMKKEGIRPNNVIFITALNACAKLGDIVRGMTIHHEILKQRNLHHCNDVVLNTALLDMYCKCGRITEAKEIFDGMCNRDMVAWSAMMAGYLQNNSGSNINPL